MNLYKLLGIKKKATTAEVRAAFRKLSKTHHPDKGGDPERFRELKEAHEVLIDPERRKRYDTTGRIEPSRVTPQRVHKFLDGTFEGVILAHDDIASVNVRDKTIRSIQNGMRQAHAEKDEVERKITRAQGLIKRFVKKGSSGIIHEIMKAKVEALTVDLHNVEDAIELGKSAIDLIAEYDYSVDPTPEGPLSAGPTFAPRYGGRPIFP